LASPFPFEFGQHALPETGFDLVLFFEDDQKRFEQGAEVLEIFGEKHGLWAIVAIRGWHRPSSSPLGGSFADIRHSSAQQHFEEIERKTLPNWASPYVERVVVYEKKSANH